MKLIMCCPNYTQDQLGDTLADKPLHIKYSKLVITGLLCSKMHLLLLGSVISVREQEAGWRKQRYPSRRLLLKSHSNNGVWILLVQSLQLVHSSISIFWQPEIISLDGLKPSLYEWLTQNRWYPSLNLLLSPGSVFQNLWFSTMQPIFL